jgi:hypothetical protein
MEEFGLVVMAKTGPVAKAAPKESITEIPSVNFQWFRKIDRLAQRRITNN